jgi:hypothetical protein
MMVGEADSHILEYSLDGRPTGWSLQLPIASRSQGYESLAYDAGTQKLWTMTEGDSHQLYAIDLRSSSFLNSLFYFPDPPRKQPEHGRPYAYGPSEMLALDDGSLLVLEREVWMARSGLRATVWCKLYRIYPENAADKQLVASWKTGLPSVPPRLANYEGMTLGPRLADGSQTIILIADSQNRYRRLLKDWFKVIILRP